jgi:ParB-like chromosome segregation protein Spo0J
MKQHPLSAAFPAMPESEFRELILDIEKNGLRHPIITFEGQILDGWHRWQACQELGIKPTMEKLGKDMDPRAYVLSGNLHRRHLTGTQRSEAIVACSEWAPAGRPEKTPTGLGFMTSKEMAKAAGVSEETIRQTKRAHEAGLGEAMKEGKVTAKEAAQVAKLPPEERQAALEAPKPKPEPKKAEPVEDVAALKARIAVLEEENADLRDRLREMASDMEGMQEELDAARRTLDAEDLLQQFNKEVKRYQELARVTQSRNNGLMNENADLTKRLKSALKKIKRHEEEKAA